MNSGASVSDDPLKAFVLDLLYPAVLGSVIVLLFVRVANSVLDALSDSATYLAIILAIYYVFGFVSSKMILAYNSRVAALDCVNSVLIFLCFYLLGFSEGTIHRSESPSVDFFWLYLLLIFVFLSPYARRFILGERTLLTIRNVMTFLSTLIAVLALLGAKGVRFAAWLTPPMVVALLVIILVAYFFDLYLRGMTPRNRPPPV